jgi:hypothetical protein
VAGLSATPACGCGAWDDVVPHLTVAEQRLADLLTHLAIEAGCAVAFRSPPVTGSYLSPVSTPLTPGVVNKLARLLPLASDSITLSVQVVGVGTRDADGSVGYLGPFPEQPVMSDTGKAPESSPGRN